MKKFILFVYLFLCIPAAFSQNFYQNYFSRAALRIDFYLSGDQNSVAIVPDEYFKEDRWAGNPANLLDTLNLGQFLVRVYHIPTNMLIFSQGYSTLFEEWQTTAEAADGAKKIMGGSIRIPFPLHRVRVEFLKRDRENMFSEQVGSFVVDPESPDIRDEKRSGPVTEIDIQRLGDPADHVDLLILGEGYTGSESDKFIEDARRLSDQLFEVDPFQKYQDLFNISAILKTSLESGVDDPGNAVYVNTPMNFSFNTFGSSRYLMTFDYKSLNDIASAVPFDAVLVLVNTDIYGGGGVYNLYASTAADNRWTANILVHELGHSFAGLGDEYYTSDVAYSDYYPRDVEPWEPNLTALLVPEKLKWQRFAAHGIAVPTPWEKDEYDEENSSYASRLTEMKEKDTAEAIEKLHRKHRDKITGFFENHPYKNKVGAFEGAGYVSRGIYRPSLDCIMFSNRSLRFDPVCTAAIEKRIRFLTVH